MTDRIEQRESWGSRAGFILAAVGSAVGLGNIWRFPYECYSHGGSAFLIPYIIAMIVIGIPMLILELSLGHMLQQAAPGSFKRVGKKWEFMGWWPIILSFVIVCYYAAVLGWCLNYLFDSFSRDLPWAQNAKAYFYEDYLEHTENYSLGGLRWKIVAAMACIWTTMYFCIFKGVKLVSKIVLWTVPIPWLMLIILMVRGLTLDGAVKGLEFFLEPRFDVLFNDPAIWKAAFAQVFFSMTVGFGVMITYASFLHRKSDINNNALIVGLADLGTSFVAGIAVFATIGAFSVKEGIPVEDVLSETQAFGLAFVAFPETLAHLPGANIFSVIFFIALLLLGIDSAFSITETALASIIDKTHWKRTTVLAVMSLIGFGIGLIFATRGGLTWLGTADSIVNEGPFGIMLIGFFECLILGYCYNLSKLRRHANKNSDWKIGIWWEWLIRYVIPVLLFSLIIWSLVDEIKDSGGYFVTNDGDLNGGNILSVAVTIILLLLSFVFALWRPSETHQAD